MLIEAKVYRQIFKNANKKLLLPVDLALPKTYPSREHLHSLPFCVALKF